MNATHQMTMISLEELVSENHQYRKFKLLFNFKAIEAELFINRNYG